MGRKKGDVIYIKSYIAAIAAAIGTALIFYRSIFGLIAGIPVGIYVYTFERKREKEKYEAALSSQFRTMLQSMMGTLEAGYALKNALLTAGKECEEIHSRKSEIVIAIEKLRMRIELNESFDSAIRQLSLDFPIEEMKDFSDVVAVTMRTGGNVIKIIRDTAEKIIAGIELKEELRTIVASRRIEQRIMTFMPAVMITFLMVSSPGLLDCLFGSLFGVIVMTVMLALNIVADYMGKRIIGRLRI